VYLTLSVISDVALSTVPLGESDEQEQEHVPQEHEQELPAPAMRFACCSAEISSMVFKLNSFIV
jgi:hypothetical protein